LGHIVECDWDHVCLLYDLPNGTTLAQKIVASSVLPITKILAIEGHKLNSTFLHVTFGSQSLLKPYSDQTDSDTNWRTDGGARRGRELEPNQIILQERAYALSSNPNSKTLQEGDEHTNQQRRSDPLEFVNAAEKDVDQSNTRIANCGQNGARTSGWNPSLDNVQAWAGQCLGSLDFVQ
jgi:hypothetical protein